MKAADVAKYFLALVDQDSGDSMSNLKLQKLLYYAQGLHLAMYGAPLFDDRIEKWTHGPVIPGVYHAYKSQGSGPLPPPAEVPEFTPDVEDHLNEVFNVFGQFSAWRLRDMTHNEPPWRNATDGCDISHAALAEYFKTQLHEEQEEGAAT